MSTKTITIDHSRAPEFEEVRGWTSEVVNQLTPEYLRFTVCEQQTALIPLTVINVMSADQLEALRLDALGPRKRALVHRRLDELTMPLLPARVGAEVTAEA